MSAAEAGVVELAHVVLPIEGMTCATCAGRIEKVLRAIPGVEATVNLSTEQADVRFDPARVAPGALAEAIGRAGFDVKRETRELAISGMTCASCAGRVEKALRAAPGVARADVNLATEKATVEGVAGVLKPADLLAAVQRAGYDGVLLTGDEARDQQVIDVEARRFKRETWRVVAAVALSAPLLLPMLGVPLPAWLQFALATPVQFVIGARFYVAAWKAVRAFAGNMDLLVSIGTSAAYVYSVYMVIAGSPAAHLDFDAAAVVIALVALGKWLEARAKRSTTAAIQALMSLRPERARVERGGIEIRTAGIRRRDWRRRRGAAGRTAAGRRRRNQRRQRGRREPAHGREPAGRQESRRPRHRRFDQREWVAPYRNDRRRRAVDLVADHRHGRKRADEEGAGAKARRPCRRSFSSPSCWSSRLRLSSAGGSSSAISRRV